MEMSSSTPLAGMAPRPSPNSNGFDNDAALAPPAYDTSTTTNTTSSPAAADVDHDAALESKVTNLKFLNATSYLLTAMMVLGVVLFRVREEGVFGDEFLWMKYQTLLTPASFVNFIWFPIFVLQGLFIYASTVHKTLQTSPLVGYDAALNGASEQSVVVHYPAVCATTLMMIYSHDYGWPFCAFLSSVLCCFVLGRIVRAQSMILNEEEAAAEAARASGEDGAVRAGYVKDEEQEAEEALTSIAEDVKGRAVQYFSLRLPFELYGGYVLALVAMYFNMFLHGSFDSLPTMAYLIVANVSLVVLLGAGFMVLWKVPERKFYGVGAALVWYLLGVALELHEPTQPIYNEFSDEAILTTQIVAGVAMTVLMTLLGVRVMKTMIKHNLFNCAGRLGGGGGENASVVSEEEDGGISTNYVHA